ncbi:MAG: hypothetical protein ACTJGH_03910 [Peptoniphilaceae bacterium]
MLEKNNWSNEIYKELINLISTYKSDKFTKIYDRNYVVSDWDNTSASFDVEEAVFIYQTMNLKFNMDKEEFEYILKKDLDLDKLNKNIKVLINDLIIEYSFLYDLKNIKNLKEIKEYEEYSKFLTNMVYMFLEFTYSLDYSTACLKIIYLFYGMTENEVRNLARNAIDYFKDYKINKKTYKGKLSNGYEFRVDCKLGLREIKEQVNLFNTLRKNKIDCYICSASLEIVVEEFACSKSFNYNFKRENISGLNLLKDKNGKFLAEVDPKKIKTYLEGKVDFIKKLERFYKKPPVLVMGDSDGDYFALSYEGLKYALIIETGSKGKISRLKNLAKKPRNSKSTIYLLQNRDNEKGLLV